MRIFEVAPLVAALSKIGGNLNQLARHANRNGQLDDARALANALGELVALIGQIQELVS